MDKRTRLQHWFRQRDDKPPYRKDMAKSVVRNRIERRIGPWYFQVASSCGYKPPYKAPRGIRHNQPVAHVDGPGFVSVQLWYGYKDLDPEEPDFARRWQADSWREAQSEVNRLVDIVRGPDLVPEVNYRLEERANLVAALRS